MGTRPTGVLLSACLLGIQTPYSGRPNQGWEQGFNLLVPAAKAAGIVFIPVCPEQLGGLPTPRPPAELQAPAQNILTGQGRVCTSTGIDVTTAFLRGAEMTMAIARHLEVSVAVMKDKSPSCGTGRVYSGEFSRRLVPGNGLVTQLLLNQGIRVFSSPDFLRLWEANHDFSFLK